ncbi:MAG: hypothetical protein ACE5IZ_07035 [Dehalococcoidia bacterium]
MQRDPNQEPEVQPQEWRTLELIAGQVEKQLDVQWQLWNTVDDRLLRLLVGFGGAFFLALLAFADRTSDLADATAGLVAAAIAVLLLSSLIAGAAWLPREFDRPPNPSHLRNAYLGTPPQETVLAIVNSMVQAYDENQRMIHEKQGAFRRAAFLLALGAFLLAAGALVELLK